MSVLGPFPKLTQWRGALPYLAQSATVGTGLRMVYVPIVSGGHKNWSTVATAGSTGPTSPRHNDWTPPSSYGNNVPIKKSKKKSEEDKKKRQEEDLRGIGSQFSSYG
ncbi:hypothetical protein F5Y08DRAFT_346419 [Xylaria arbuscula]|nr:hypothetical protein F5Y08DRAFT_346419 [Xylaria arbuscula]